MFIYIGPERTGVEIHPAGKIVVLDNGCACMTLLEAPRWKGTRGDYSGDGNSDIFFPIIFKDG